MDRFVHRELVLLALLITATVVTFFVTRAFAASNQALRLADARAWYALGERALGRGDLQEAVDALRRASAKNPEEPSYRLSLSRVLMTASEDDAARQVLLDLRERQPEDSETNLLLARLETRSGDRTAVGRYYQNAIVGLWKPEQRAAQRQVRIEFIEFLLGRGERDRALSELLVLEASLPDDLPSQLAAGRMLLAAGDARRAREHFTRALRLDAKNGDALGGAAESSFEVGDYAGARGYLGRIGVDTDRTRALHVLIDLVLDNDPLAPRLSQRERENRLAAGLAHVQQRLETCLARPPAERVDPTVDLDAPLADVRAASEDEPKGRVDSNRSERIEPGFDAIYRAVRAADRACRSPEPFDRALLLIGRRHGLEDP